MEGKDYKSYKEFEQEAMEGLSPEEKERIEKKLAIDDKIADFCKFNKISSEDLITHILGERVFEDKMSRLSFDIDTEKYMHELDNIAYDTMSRTLDDSRIKSPIQACNVFLYIASRMIKEEFERGKEVPSKINEMISKDIENGNIPKPVVDALNELGLNPEDLIGAIVCGPKGITDLTDKLQKGFSKARKKEAAYEKIDKTIEDKKQEATASAGMTKEQFDNMSMQNKIDYLFKQNHVR